MTQSRCWPIVGLLVMGCLSGCPRSKVSPTADPKTTYQLSAVPGPPPWRVPRDSAARLALAGLPRVTDAHAGAYHIHAGLRIYYGGQSVVVPAGIGLDRYDVPVSPVHTHRATGVIHIENAVPATFTWGQFFTLWGVPLGGATVYVNAMPVSNLADLAFADQQQVVVIFGAPPAGPIAWLTPDPEAEPTPSPAPTGADGSQDDGSDDLASPEPSATPTASPDAAPTATPSASP